MKVLCISSFAADTFETALQAWSNRMGLTQQDYTFSWLNYGCFNPANTVRADVHLVLLRLQDLAVQHPESLEPVLTHKSTTKKRARHSPTTAPQRAQLSDSALTSAAQEVVRICSAVATTTTTPLLLVLLPPPPLDCRPNTPRAHLYTALELQIRNELHQHPFVHVELSSSITHDLMPNYPLHGYTPELDCLQHSPYTTAALVHMAGLCWRLLLRATLLSSFPRKVVALDCDNTLWDGVLGEDGPNQLGFGQAAPHRLFLHRQMRTLQAKGMLLCLVSKNNDKDVLQVFRQQYDNVHWLLNIDQHIVARRVNWSEK